LDFAHRTKVPFSLLLEHVSLHLCAHAVLWALHGATLVKLARILQISQDAQERCAKNCNKPLAELLYQPRGLVGIFLHGSGILYASPIFSASMQKCFAKLGEETAKFWQICTKCSFERP
jgi:hypothetical protein